MFKFNEKTLDNFRQNAEVLMLNDPLIRGLFDCMCNSSKEELPPYGGSFLMFYEQKTDDMVVNLFEDENDLSIKELTEIFRQRVVEELKDLIDAEIEY